MEQPLQAELRYSPQLVQMATRRYWHSLFGSSFWWAMLILAGALLFGWASASSTWWDKALAAVWLLCFLFAWWMRWLLARRARVALRDLGEPATAQLTLSDARFQIATRHGEMALAWPRVTQLRQYPEHWTLILAGGAPMTLPLESLPDPMRDFLQAQVERHGGKVVELW